MRKSDIRETKDFKVNDNVTITCRWIKTRNGFKHEAELRDRDFCKGTVKVCYLNRTWEGFEYETVIRKALEKLSAFTSEEQKVILDGFRSRNMEEVNRMFSSIAMVAKMGEILCTEKSEKNDWKARMLKAGLGEGLSMPADWETLSEEEKETRLNNVIESMSK